MDARTRQILESEKDPRILQALIVQALEHIELQRATIRQLEAEQAKKDQASFVFEERVKLLRRQLFGQKSEKRPEATDRPRDKSQTEALLFSQSTFPAPESREKKEHQLPENIIEHHLSENELVSESALRGFTDTTVKNWKATGLFEDSIKIQIIERKYVRLRHRKFKYKYVGTESPEKDIILTASGTGELLPGMGYTTEFVASVVSDKYISHMPLERQTREMESLGLYGIKNSTLSKHMALAASSLETLQEKILKEDLLGSELALHIDETPWKIQNKHEKDGFMWVISNRSGAYYFYQPTRSGKSLHEKLGSYKGPVVTDGFSGYNCLEEIEIPHAHCWAHARRELLPLENHDPKIKPILDHIDALFEIEREAKDFEDLKNLREKKSKPTLERLEQLLSDELPKARNESQKKKAIEYVLKRWSGLTLFADDTRVPLSNNEAERTIRHAVMGRKNFYGSGCHSGAHTAATLYSVIESCKKNDIDPRTFLLMSLKHAAKGEDLETPLAYARRTRQPVN